jgi:hypothetical protein
MSPGYPPPRRPPQPAMPPRSGGAVVAEEVAFAPGGTETPAEEAQETPVITPEAVCFRSADEICRNCQYWEADGNCSVLNMTVGEGDSCNAFLSGGGTAPATEEGPPVPEEV